MNLPPDDPQADVLLSLNRASTTARLTSGAIHDVNNALQVIAGSVELLEQQPDIPLPIGKALDRIRRQCERAAGALAELQRFTKAGLDGRERFDLRGLVERSLALRRYAMARAGLTLEWRAGDADAVAAVGNAGYAQQAVLNLLINAEQALAGRQGTISVGFRREDARVGVEVSDSGNGVDPSIQERLFTPFVSSKSPLDGAGLGLWCAQTIATAAGGRVDIASTTTGTTVVFWLPTELV